MATWFGRQTVTFLSVNPTGAAGLLGTFLQTQTGVDVKGCRHRPIHADHSSRALTREFPEVGVSIATQWYQTTAPPVAAALAARPQDLLRVNGIKYVIIGEVELFYDLAGKVVKVTIMSERQDIGH